MYINPENLSNQSNPAPGLLKLTEEQAAVYIQYNGFIRITSTDPVEIEPDMEAYQAWCAENPTPDALESARAAKEAELSAACNIAIENGLDIQLGDVTEHFNYSEKDQLNIKEMFDAVRMGATQYPYQSETGDCRVYSSEEIKLIYQTLAGHKTGNITYYHQLKSYVDTLETVDEVNSVVYGQKLTGEYLQHYNDMMAVVQSQMAAVLSAE